MGTRVIYDIKYCVWGVVIPRVVARSDSLGGQIALVRRSLGDARRERSVQEWCAVSLMGGQIVETRTFVVRARGKWDIISAGDVQ